MMINMLSREKALRFDISNCDFACNNEKYVEATRKINTARVVDGDLTVRSVSLAIKYQPKIEVEQIQ